MAQALIRVEQGTSYANAANATREVGNRIRQPSTRPARPGRWHTNANYHRQLVGNWLKVFSPVIAAAYRSASWPERLVTDSRAAVPSLWV